MTDSVVCPECGGGIVIRYGKRGGRQRYRCRHPSCTVPGGYQFMAESRGHLIDDKTRRVVQRLLAQGVRPAKIKEAIPEVSLRWIYIQKRKLKSNQD